MIPFTRFPASLAVTRSQRSTGGLPLTQMRWLRACSSAHGFGMPERCRKPSPAWKPLLGFRSVTVTTWRLHSALFAGASGTFGSSKDSLLDGKGGAQPTCGWRSKGLGVAGYPLMHQHTESSRGQTPAQSLTLHELSRILWSF